MFDVGNHIFWASIPNKVFNAIFIKVFTNLLKIFILAILEIGIGMFITKALRVPSMAYHVILGLLVWNLAMLVLLFFIDPGTYSKMSNKLYMMKECSTISASSTNISILTIGIIVLSVWRVSTTTALFWEM